MVYLAIWPLALLLRSTLTCNNLLYKWAKVCLFVRIFSNFDLKFGRKVDLDELNNVIKGTFLISPLSTELFTLENRAKIAVLHIARLITFEPLGQFTANIA